MKLMYEPAHMHDGAAISGMICLTVPCPTRDCDRTWTVMCTQEGIKGAIAYHEACETECHAIYQDFRETVARILEEEAAYCEYAAEQAGYFSGRPFELWRAKRRMDMAKAVREQKWGK